ncbi:MAG: DUF1015 domain-containing protein [Lachnoanaerobaculum sp.]|uniref:DUF1015 domain-containing protein n=1 Tax=Lachnoanaerobaculum sp. TaxID=2049030 RepID=UPI0025BB1013|nr:DUF1015 domain-containing protein [Lachnoanaerobaculum sp.]MBS5881542.1 DUF1015 domain-containing protein [Lachnoanaerobaculum sp.]
MAVVKSFKCVRPVKELAEQVASLPYDVYDRKEAKAAVSGKPYAFLNIDRPETAFDDSLDMYSKEAYEKAKNLYEEFKNKGIYEKDNEDSYYLYELTMNGRSQIGIVGLASVDDYLNDIIKKHENTREEKEIDRIKHVDTVNAQTGPIFLAYKKNDDLKKIISDNISATPIYDFVSDDGIGHRVWKVDKAYNEQIRECFENIESLYIADRHHRAASAVKVALKRRQNENNPNAEYNYFLSVIFDERQLHILPYNRIVLDLNKKSVEEVIRLIAENFDITESPVLEEIGDRGEFGMLVKDKFYILSANKKVLDSVSGDVIKSLDVSILQDLVLEPIFGIKDPRTDERIKFAGGIRGVGYLKSEIDNDRGKVAFLMYPTSMEELFAVADENKLMPPKSTWFEPKLRSGIFIHEI